MKPNTITIRKSSPTDTYSYIFDRSGDRPRHWPADAWVTLEERSPGLVRMDMRAALGNQRRHVFRLAHGLVLETSMLASGASAIDAVEPRVGQLELVALVEGSVETLPQDACPGRQVQAGQASLHVSVPGEVSAVHIGPHQRVGWVALTGDPALIATHFGLRGGEGTLRALFGDMVIVDLDGGLRRGLRELVDVAGDDPVSLLRAEALALNLLLALLGSRIREERPIATIPGTSLSARELEQLQAVRATLSTNFESPPTIADLARRVGTNQSKLMRGFKLLYGETLADFALRQRMERAQSLLTEDRLSAAEVAYRVGYQHHSSFTYAFSRFFGYPPSQARPR